MTAFASSAAVTGSDSSRGCTVAMVVIGDASHDSRILKEAHSLASEGYVVHVVCVAPPRESYSPYPGVEMLFSRAQRDSHLGWRPARVVANAFEWLRSTIAAAKLVQSLGGLRNTHRSHRL
jgi:hypothetical protein